MFDKEFRLAVAACGWNFTGDGAARIKQLSADINWDRFVAVVRRHRIEALAWQCLDQLGIALPTAIARQLSADAEAIVGANLRAAREMVRLRDAFAEAGLPILFVKGLTLSALAYHNPFIKMACDVDILVDASAIEEAGNLLSSIGYARAPPLRGTLAAWHRNRKESGWRSADTALDLHTRLADSLYLIPAIGLDSPRQLVPIVPGIELETLAPSELFAYLCVHGASSAWFRLKWVTDLAALLHGLSAQEISQLYDHSQQLGAGRTAGQALLLAERLYGIELGEALKRHLAGDRTLRALVRIAVRELTGRTDLKEPTEVRLGTAMIHCSQLLLFPGLRGKARELHRQLRDIMT
ncbi:MAG: nucleotidyltransferase family protein [Pseudomonadota bacterium]|nr:nucleotidyltransferase family protein [Pseudomonadota bacterium]